MSRIIERFGYANIAKIACAVVLLPHIFVPFNYDSELYHSMGWQLQAFGQLPYVGSWDMNFPGIVFIHAAVISLFGTSEFAFCVVDTLVQLAIALILYRIVARWSSQRAALITSLLFCLYVHSGGVSLAGQRDGFGNLLILIAYDQFFALAKPKHEARISVAVLVIATTMAGAIILRPTNLLLLLLLSVALVASKRMPLNRLLYLVGIVIVIFFLALLPFLFADRGLDEAYLSTVRFNLDVYGTYRTSFLESLTSLQEILIDLALLLSLGWLWLKRWKAVITHEISPSELFLMLSTYIGSRLILLAMGKFFGYQYELIAIMSLVFVGIAVSEISQMIRRPSIRSWILLSLLLIGCLLLWPWKYALRRPVYYYAELENLRSYLQKKSDARTRIELCALDAGIYWRAERRPASRFTDIIPLAMKPVHHDYASYQSEWQQEFVSSLVRNRPEFVILATQPKESRWLPKSPADFLHGFSGFDSVLASSYRFDTTVEWWDVYRLSR